MAARSNVSHPYYPKSLQLPHYMPNDKSVNELLIVFFGLTIISSGIVLFTTRSKKHLSIVDRLVVTWLFVCALIHIVIEGYFSMFHASLAGHMTFLGQLWKEYSLADSRYLSSDTCVLAVESITALIDGPLCIAAVVAFFIGSSYRYILLMLVSSFQLYGDVIYFSTEILEDFAHGQKGHPLYFWFYFIFLNSWWIVVPCLMIIRSFFKLASCQSAADGRKIHVKKRK